MTYNDGMTMHPLMVFTLSGLFFAVAFIYSSCFWCFIPAFIFLLYGITLERSVLKLFAYGTLTGTLHYAGSFFWVWSTFPIQWLADAPVAIQLSAIGVYWVLTSIAMGLSGGVFVLLARMCINNVPRLLILVPVLWVASELFRSFLFSVYAFGPGSFLNVGFSYGYLGYLLAEEPHLLQFASLAGVYGLSYLAALIGTGAFVLCNQKRKVQAAALVLTGMVVILSFLVPPFAVHKNQNTGTEVIAIEMYFDHQFDSQEGAALIKHEALEEAVGYALRQNPDAIILSEEAQFRKGFATDEALIAWAHAQTEKTDIVIVDSGPAIDDRGTDVLRSYMYDLRDNGVYFVDKRYLVPQGEYLSYMYRFLLSFFLSSEEEKQVNDFARFKPGIASDDARYPKHLPGILFCFETMVPYGVRHAQHFRDPAFIAHPISHSWFVDPFSLEYQLDAMLKVSAVWNAIPIVSAGSMTESKLFLPNGEMQFGEILREGEHWKVRRFTF